MGEGWVLVGGGSIGFCGGGWGWGFWGGGVGVGVVDSRCFLLVVCWCSRIEGGVKKGTSYCFLFRPEKWRRKKKRGRTHLFLRVREGKEGRRKGGRKKNRVTSSLIFKRGGKREGGTKNFVYAVRGGG